MFFKTGAREAKGLCVIIDVFRACSVLCYAADQYPSDIIISSDLSQIKKIKKIYAGGIFIGKNHQSTDDLFNTFNSPSLINKRELTSKVIVHHSEGGIGGVIEASNADEVITGSFVNAKAVVRYIRSKDPQQITLVCMGYLGVQPAEEDEFCADYIKSLLEEKQFDIDDMMNSLERSTKSFFLRGDNHVPPEDFYLCTELNCFDFILKKETIGDVIKLIREDI